MINNNITYIYIYISHDVLPNWDLSHHFSPIFSPGAEGGRHHRRLRGLLGAALGRAEGSRAAFGGGSEAESHGGPEGWLGNAWDFLVLLKQRKWGND